MRKPRTHDLKCLPKFFRPLRDGEKTFEVRYDDRDYRKDDLLVIREWKRNRYTQALPLIFRVTYVLRDYPHLNPNYVVLGIQRTAHDPQTIQDFALIDAARLRAPLVAAFTKPSPFIGLLGEVDRHKEPVERTPAKVCGAFGGALDTSWLFHADAFGLTSAPSSRKSKSP